MQRHKCKYVSEYTRKGESTITNPLQQLKTLGHSVWYNIIDRGQLLSGQFQRLIDENGITP